MEKIFIATTTYCKHSLEPLNLLKSHGFHVDTNEKGRKLTDYEISETKHTDETNLHGIS